MPGINADGVPNVENYHLGGGKLLISELDSSGLPGAYRHLGNTSELTSSVESEVLDHYSALGTLRVKDASVVTQVTSNLSFVLDEVGDFDNLALFFSGSAEVYTNPAIAGVADAVLIADGAVVVNRWYPLFTGASKSAPAFSPTATNDLTLSSTNGTPVVLVEDTDYEVDNVSGTIFLKSTAATLQIITDSDGVTFTLTADALAPTVDRVTMLSANQKIVALRFVGENAQDNEQVIYDFWRVVLSANGDMPLISEDWSGMPMQGNAEKNANYDNVGDVWAPTQ